MLCVPMLWKIYVIPLAKCSCCFWWNISTYMTDCILVYNSLCSPVVINISVNNLIYHFIFKLCNNKLLAIPVEVKSLSTWPLKLYSENDVRISSNYQRCLKRFSCLGGWEIHRKSNIPIGPKWRRGTELLSVLDQLVYSMQSGYLDLLKLVWHKNLLCSFAS